MAISDRLREALRLQAEKHRKLIDFLIKANKMLPQFLRTRRKRRFGVRQGLQKRKQFGFYHGLFKHLHSNDPWMFAEHFRMSPQTFDALFAKVAPFMRDYEAKSYWREKGAASIAKEEAFAMTLL